MSQDFLKFIAAAVVVATPFTSFCDETPPPPPDPIILIPQTGTHKRIPPRYNTFLSYSESEACLSTSMPYAYAVIEVSDIDGNVYSSMIATPEESCGYLLIEPSSSITVTFDNGTTLYGSY